MMAMLDMESIILITTMVTSTRSLTTHPPTPALRLMRGSSRLPTLLPRFWIMMIMIMIGLINHEGGDYLHG